MKNKNFCYVLLKKPVRHAFLAVLAVCFASGANASAQVQPNAAKTTSAKLTSSEISRAGAHKIYRTDWLGNDAIKPVCTQAPESSVNPKILLALRKRDLQLDVRAAQLDKKQSAVLAAERVLSEQLKALDVVKSKLEEINAKRKDRANAHLHNLAKMYQVMQPRDAAQIFDQLDDKLAAELLKQMDIRHGAAILAAMTTKKSISATEELAGTRQGADTVASYSSAATPVLSAQ